MVQMPVRRRDVRVSDREVMSIPLEEIVPNPYQPRRTFTNEALEELCMSIRQYGLLQPISVRRVRGGHYELIAGERRLRACRMAGWTHIDAIVFSAYEQDSAVIAMIENLQRENLHYMEEAEGYQNLIRDHNLSQDELARRLGKSQSTIANKMRILKLPAQVKRILYQYSLTERHARALLRLHDDGMQLKIAKQVAEQGLNVKKTEDLVERTLNHLYGIAEEEKQRKQVSSFIRDARLFMNSIKTVIGQMESAGLDPKFERNETEDGLRMVIFIPKKT
jgi:ParB family chromosome partitioning protein